MSDKDILCAFFPNQRPGANDKQAVGDYRSLFWQVGRSRGMSERQIQAAYADQFKGK